MCLKWNNYSYIVTLSTQVKLNLLHFKRFRYNINIPGVL